MFCVRMLAVVAVMSVALQAAAQRIEVPVAPAMPPMVPTFPTIVIPPPPPPAPLAPDMHVHAPQQCCHQVCTQDYSCPAGNFCPQRCTNFCTQC